MMTDDEGEDEGSELGGGPDPVLEEDASNQSKEEGSKVGGGPDPALEPKRLYFISDKFNECFRTVFEEILGHVTSQQVVGKIQENT